MDKVTVYVWHSSLGLSRDEPMYQAYCTINPSGTKTHIESPSIEKLSAGLVAGLEMAKIRVLNRVPRLEEGLMWSYHYPRKLDVSEVEELATTLIELGRG
jgi:hypothetical protein